MKALLIWPDYTSTFQSLDYLTRFSGIKALSPPLGLLTVAAMLPQEWKKKLIDLRLEKLKDTDLEWADYVFLSALVSHKESIQEILTRCKRFNVTIVAGGPFFSSNPELFTDIDYLVLDEAEITLPNFLNDLKKGVAKRIYRADRWANLEETPIPLWEIINPKKYISLSMQYSRGCHYDCEFCDVTRLFGHKQRTKTCEQIIAELDRLFEIGCRDRVFIVDDNFICNKKN